MLKDGPQTVCCEGPALKAATHCDGRYIELLEKIKRWRPNLHPQGRTPSQ